MAGVEACDDGNQNDEDTCRNDCSLPQCGDGIVQLGEECDDGNGVDTDARTSLCQAARCGDGFVHRGIEACDDGNLANSDRCTDSCQVNRCGDGFVHIGVEACDDGNDSNNDGCLTTCEPAACGDGFVHDGVVQCDDANQDNTDGCLSGCVTFKWCRQNRDFRVEPSIVCENDQPDSVNLISSAQDFIFVNDTSPLVTVDGTVAQVLGRGDCEPIFGALVESERCSRIEVAQPAGLGVGTFEVRVIPALSQDCSMVSPLVWEPRQYSRPRRRLRFVRLRLIFD